MLYLKGHLARPLDAFLAPPSRLAVLRQLARRDRALNGRQIARLAGINHQSAAAALGELESLGVVRRSGSGRSTGWSLVPGSWIAEELLFPLFDKELAYAHAVVGAIKKALKDKVAAAAVVGPAVGGGLRPGAVLQLVVVEKAGRRPVAAALRELGEELERRWLVGLHARVLPREKAQRAAWAEQGWQLLPAEGPPAL